MWIHNWSMVIEWMSVEHSMTNGTTISLPEHTMLREHHMWEYEKFGTVRSYEKLGVMMSDGIGPMQSWNHYSDKEQCKSIKSVSTLAWMEKDLRTLHLELRRYWPLITSEDQIISKMQQCDSWLVCHAPGDDPTSWSVQRELMSI